MNELRYDPILREWVIVASHREKRPVDAQKGAQLEKTWTCPFCPDAPEGAGEWDVKYTYNKFASVSLTPDPDFVPKGQESLYTNRPAIGNCEVLLYSQDHDATFGDLSVAHITKLVDLWDKRYQANGAREEINFVFEFENRGSIIGVSLSHPHGQLYSFDVVPVRMRRILESAREYHAEHDSCLFCDLVSEEQAEQTRVVYENEGFLAVVPYFAHWPYEVHVYPKHHMQHLGPLDAAERTQFARAMKTVVQKYDNLHGFTMPYTMGLYFQPTDGQSHDYYHFHVQFYPACRGPDRQKFVGGVESHCGIFINSSNPDEVAQRIRASPSDESPE